MSLALLGRVKSAELNIIALEIEIGVLKQQVAQLQEQKQRKPRKKTGLNNQENDLDVETEF